MTEINANRSDPEYSQIGGALCHDCDTHAGTKCTREIFARSHVLGLLQIDVVTVRRSPLISVLPILAMLMSNAGAFAQDVVSKIATLKPDCQVSEPDSVEISWQTPCETDSWLLDTETGCRMWDWHPEPRDTATWTGACSRGLKEGRGVVQWFEHGRPIDRFEGTYIAGRRDGLGRYQWNDHDRFYGKYVNDIPNGFGTASIAGETFSGEWKNGCLSSNGHVVAIGVPRTSCAMLNVQK